MAYSGTSYPDSLGLAMGVYSATLLIQAVHIVHCQATSIDMGVCSATLLI